MNGARTIFRRKGYLLTALATAVLLAASSGTASAQLTITLEKSPETDPAKNTVTEGAVAVYTVEVDGYLHPGSSGTSAGNITVTLAVPSPNAAVGAIEGEPEDISGTSATVREVNISYPDVAVGDSPVRIKKTASIRVQTTHDGDAENEAFTLAFSAATIPNELREGRSDSSTTVVLVEDGVGGDPDALTIVDDEDQEYKLTAAALGVDLEAEEGINFAVTVTAKPAHEDGSANVAVQVDVPRTTASVTEGPQPINMGDPSQEFNISVGANDMNRDEDTVVITAWTGTAGNAKLADTLSVTIKDANELPAVAMMMVDEDGDVLDPQPTSVEEGDSIMVVVMPVNKDGETIEAAEDLTVALTPTGNADELDYDVKRSVTIDEESEVSDPVEIEVEANDDVGTEMLMFNAVVSGDSANGPGTRTSEGVLSLTIEDETDPLITPRTTDADYQVIKDAIAAVAGDDGLNPEDVVTLMTRDLFDVMTGYDVDYSGSADSDAVSVRTSSTTVTITADMAGEAKVTVTGTATMESSSLTSSQTVSNRASVTFLVEVVDTALVVTVEADPAEIMEGGTSTITATANRAIQAGDGAVEIGLTVVGDGTLDADSLMIDLGGMSNSTMLTATEDDDMEDETVTVVASGSGIDGAMQVKIVVTDNDEAPVEPEPENTIEPKSEPDAYPVITGAIDAGAGEDGLNPGESFEVPASELFDVDEGYEASYSASVDNGDVASTSVSGDSVTVMADAAGEAKVTISGTSRMASSSFAPDQVATNMADITFLVTVVDKDLVVMLEMPANVMDGNIVEGESYDIKVSANRMVSEDTEVMIMRDRAGSDAGEDDFTVSSATIMAGYDSATAELMVTEDMLPDSGTDDNMGEQLVLFGMVNGEQTNALTFTIWDQAVPALPLFGQLLLALFLMLGGARLYRRRQG